MPTPTSRAERIEASAKTVAEWLDQRARDQKRGHVDLDNPLGPRLDVLRAALDEPAGETVAEPYVPKARDHQLAELKLRDQVRSAYTGVCPYCQKPRGGSMKGRLENPYCAACLSERAATGYDHICASNLQADHREFACRRGPGEVVDMSADSCGFCKGGICVQSLADGVVIHQRSAAEVEEKT